MINEEGFPIASYSHLPVGLEVKVYTHRETVSTFSHTPSCASCHNKGISTNPRSVHNTHACTK